jgi:hypothetical protein
MFKFPKQKKKRRKKIVKENKESIEIFRNIFFFFNMESPYLIKLFDKHVLKLPFTMVRSHEQNRQVWSKTNVREHYPA